MFGVIGEPWSLSPRSPLASDLTRWLREPLGSFRIAERTPGLEVVFEPAEDPAREPLLDRLTVRFVQTIEIALQLLSDGRLDAAALPATVNLVERLHAQGLNSAIAAGDEVVYLDLRGAEPDRATRAALAHLSDVAGLETAFVRELGRPTATLHPGTGAAGTRGPFRPRTVPEVAGGGRRIRLAAPVGDELLSLFQRALHDDWERRGFEVDVVTIDARTFYGPWAEEPEVEAALRRGDASFLPGDRAASERLSLVPLFQMDAVVAFRDGVHGVTAPGPGRGPLGHAERWWTDG